MGMICSEREIGCSSHAGILVLPDDAVVGTPQHSITILQAITYSQPGLTPNRPDAMSHGCSARFVSIF